MYAYIGKKGVWYFEAPTEKDSEEIAAVISAMEPLACGKMTGFRNGLVWEAVCVRYEDVEKIEITFGRIKPIRRQKKPPVDAIYMTRRQKERENKI